MTDYSKLTKDELGKKLEDAKKDISLALSRLDKNTLFRFDFGLPFLR